MIAMLTTVDNPFDPFTQFDEWYAWDTRHGYYTTSFLARVVHYSLELSENDQAIAVEQAIDDIVAINPNGMYRKLVRES